MVTLQMIGSLNWELEVADAKRVWRMPGQGTAPDWLVAVGRSHPPMRYMGVASHQDYAILFGGKQVGKSDAYVSFELHCKPPLQAYTMKFNSMWAVDLADARSVAGRLQVHDSRVPRGAALDSLPEHDAVSVQSRTPGTPLRTTP